MTGRLADALEQESDRGPAVIQTFRTSARRAILVNAGSLVGTTAVTAGLGFVYWLVAARVFSPGVVGLASALISAMSLLGFVGMLGLGSLLMGELPRQPERASSLITSAVVASAFAGAVLGLIFAIVASDVSAEFHPLGESLSLMALFAFGVALTSASLVLDQALIGMLFGGLQFARNACFAVVKLAALALLSLWASDQFGTSIYATWAVGNLVAFVMVAAVGASQGWWRLNALPEWNVFHGLRRAAAGHHALNLALQFPVLALPIVVTGILSAAFNAYFYVAWMVATSFVWVAPYALSVVLYTVGSKNPATVHRAARFTIGLSFLLGLVGIGAIQLLSGPVLSIFGATYALHAGTSLRIMVLAVVPLVIKDHFVSISRLEGRLAQGAMLVSAGAILEVVGAAIGAHLGGLIGLSLGWVAMICIEAVVMFPAVFRVVAPAPSPRAAA
jgi:O-antigen/teichoic acid export membrane protein